MARLEKLEALERLIRQDDVAEIGIPTWEFVREAIKAGDTDEAVKWLDYGCGEAIMMHDNLIAFIDDALTYLASNHGEEEVYRVVRNRYDSRIRHWLDDTPGAKECMQRGVEYQRGHGGITTVTEEADRFVVKCDPCGSGGRLRQRKKNIATIKNAYPWTWGRSDIPVYCSHCAIMWEILPIEMRGYQIRVNLCAEKPEDPCIHYYYKNREAIPEEYFTRVGKTKR